MASQSSFGPDTQSCLIGGGDMGALMRAHDWSATPLGPVGAWPQSLRTSVSTCLNSRFAILVWWGPDLVMLYNDAYREIIGSKHPAALGRPGRECWPEIWHIIGPMLENVLTRGEATWSDDLLLNLERHGYSEECYFTFSYSPIRDESGGVGGVFTPVAETTDKVIGARRLKTLQELASRSRTRDVTGVCLRAAETLSRNTKDVPFSTIYLYDEDRRPERVACSGNAASLPPPEVFTPQQEAAIRRAARSGQPEVELEPEISTGEPRLGGTSAIVLPLLISAQSPPVGFLAAGVSPQKRLDASYRTFFELAAGQVAAGIAEARAYAEEKRRAEALAEIDRAKTQFFSNVSHEFRTPLTLMLAPLENAVSTGALPPEDIPMLHRNGMRLLRLVNTLLDFSRLEAGRMRARYVATDLAGLTRDAAAAFESAMKSAGLEYRVECDPLSEPVYVDREMWEKIVLNLLSNALKFTLEGAIHVGLRSQGPRVELTVSDTGTGIPPNELAHIFERFHRIEGAQGRTHEGSGIGLAFVQELVKLHGGDLRASSVVGKGSTFTVSIPTGTAHLPAENLSSPADPVRSAARPFVEEALRWLPAGSSGEAEEHTKSIAQAGAPKPRILVVDDNADMRYYVRRVLRDLCEVTCCPDGEAGLAALRGNNFDLVISDVMMPRLDGFGLIERMRSNPETSSIPVILLSARAGEESSVEALRSGADAYLVKPFSPRELLAQVQSRVALAAMREKAAEQERELRRQAELERGRWQALLQNAPAAMAVLRGPDLRFELVNDEYVRASGRPDTASFIGRRVLEALPELADQGYFETLLEVYQSGRPVVGRRKMLKLDRSGDGTLEDRYFNCAYQPARSATGEIEGVLVHAVDITEEVLALRRLEESEAQFRSLANSIPNLAFTADADGARQWFNDRWYEYTGRTREETAGWGWIELHHPERADRVVAGYRRQIERGEPWEDTVRLRRHDGKYGWFLSRAIPIHNSEGRIVRWFGTNTDVTSEMEARERLRASEERATVRASELQAIMDAVPAAIYISREPECREFLGNRAAYEWLRLPVGEPIRPRPDREHPVPFRITRNGRPIPVEDLPLQTSARELRPVEDYEFNVEFPDGQRRTLFGNAVPLLDDSGRSRGAVAAFIDITESRRMQERLRDAHHLESIGLLAGGVAHDFNNLLVPILGYASVVGDILEPDNPARPFVSEIERAAERAAYLTRQMLAYAGKARFVIDRIDLESAAREAAGMVEASVSKSVSIEVDVQPGLPRVEGDAGEIQQLLMNLILNAAEAVGDRQGTVAIRLRTVRIANPAAEGFLVAGQVTPGTYVCVDVSDTGCGIGEEIRGKIFDPFFSTKLLGRGLGLAAVAGIVRSHHWGLRLETSPEKGSRFEVFLRTASPGDPNGA